MSYPAQQPTGHQTAPAASSSRSVINKILSGMKILIGSTIFLIPSGIPYREVLTEACYSLSQIISLATQSMNNSSFSMNTYFEHMPYLMQFLGVFISSLEIFIESATRYMFRCAQLVYYTKLLNDYLTHILQYAIHSKQI